LFLSSGRRPSRVSPSSHESFGDGFAALNASDPDSIHSAIPRFVHIHHAIFIDRQFLFKIVH